MDARSLFVALYNNNARFDVSTPCLGKRIVETNEANYKFGSRYLFDTEYKLTTN